MPLSDFRDTYSWQEAVELGPKLVNLAEQLPASEEMGLSYQLRQVMVRLPASIAYDLLEGGSYGRKTQITRLAAMLDLIDKVYPALDAADVRADLEKLADRVSGDRFGEQTPGAAKAYLPGAGHPGPIAADTVRTEGVPVDAPHHETVPAEAGPATLEPEPALPPAAATSAPTLAPEPETAPVAAAEPTHITVQAAAQEDTATHVQPDSVQ